MKNYKTFSRGVFLTTLFCCITSFLCAQINYAKLVNPFIGTGGHGHTYPGATSPHGMVQLSPDTRLEGWDGCGGYHYSDNYIYGFSHMHLSGTGIPDYCDILVMPMTGKPSPDNKIYGSTFSHKNEKASAGYYSVLLAKGNIQTEFTTTERVGLHHYVFSKAAENSVILDLKHRDEVLESTLKIEDSVTVSGMRRSRSWAENQVIYFVMKFSKPVKNTGVWNNDALQRVGKSEELSSKNLKAFFQFEDGEKNIYVKVALSTVSADGAKNNLEAEMPGWDFEDAKLQSEIKWNVELSKIKVEGNAEKKRIFYTALYHTAVVPNINMDTDGSYRGMDNKIHKAEGFVYYSVFSLWDTYRGAHPLYTIIDRKRTLDYIKTFLAQYREGGRLPVWELASNETECMIGYHCVPVIVDAYMKGIRDFDVKLALEAMVHSANLDHFGLSAYRSKGLIESTDEQESVSRTLEYSYDDWCIAQFAKAIGDNSVAETFEKRGQYYQNVLDLQSGFMRPRKNGDWLSPFDPRRVDNNFTEANSWQYSFYFPQNIDGYTKLAGNKDSLERRLDRLFSTSSKTTGRDQSDITGLIGQYAHGNEPSHHIAYLYNHTNAPYKTQKLVHKIMTEFYKNSPDGLIGNEDCGQMSAWYVLSAMGFYPVTPGSNNYEIGSPLFNEIHIDQENKNELIIKANGITDAAIYASWIEFNKNNEQLGALLSRTISQDRISEGGVIQFDMSAKQPAPYVRGRVAKKKVLDTYGFVANPIIRGGETSFQSDREISMSTTGAGIKIFYTEDGSIPDENSLVYSRPVPVDRSKTIKAIAYDAGGNKSFVTTALYKKIENDWLVKLNSKYEQMYDGGGAFGLIDGIRGETNWRKGNWQGYQNADVDVVVDLKKVRSITSVTAGFLQDTRAWIVMPKEIIIETSVDGIRYTSVGFQKNILPIEDLKTQLIPVKFDLSNANARFVRLKAIQYGKLPAWHEGAGGSTHIFIDEIEVK